MVSLPRGFEFSRRNRLIVYYLLGVTGLVLVYATLYNVAMAHLEGVDQSIFASIEFVVQTMTTTGYGQDAGLWSHPLMFLFVATVQLSGIGLGFFTLRVIIIPLFTDAEIDLDARLTPKRDHVVVCEYRRDSSVLLDEFDELDVDYVLLSSSEADARRLSDQGYAAIDGSPQDASALERASVRDARVVVADAGDANVNAILTVQSVAPDVDIVALADDGEMRDVLRTAGADSVLSPHGLLGRRLGEKAVSAFSSELIDTVDLGPGVEVMELPLLHGSPLLGTRIRNSGIRERTGATVVGAWIDGELQLPPDPDAVLRANTVLLASGTHEALTDLSDFTRPPRTPRRHGRVVVVGLGEVGRAARSVVADADADVTTVDADPETDPDVVGDARSRETFRAADIEDADAVIVCLPDDSDTLLTTLLARSLNPDVEVLVRVTAADATRKALSAGADYVLSVPRVSARMVARELRGEDVLAPASQIRIDRVSARPFDGTTLADSGIYETTGCRVIAVEDADGRAVAAEPSHRFAADERIVLVGPDEAVQRFRKRYDVSSSDAT
jgi:Trk K+ transport system NAD-binding subunit